MAKKVSFGLTLPNRGVVLGITTVKEMLTLAAAHRSLELFAVEVMPRLADLSSDPLPMAEMAQLVEV